MVFEGLVGIFVLGFLIFVVNVFVIEVLEVVGFVVVLILSWGLLWCDVGLLDLGVVDFLWIIFCGCELFRIEDWL